MTEINESETLGQLSHAYETFGGLMDAAIAGEDINVLDGKLLEMYTGLSGATDPAWMDASTKGTRAGFVQAATNLKGRLLQMESLPRALQERGKVISAFEKDVSGLVEGFLNERIVSRIVDETGIQPIEELVDAGKTAGYHEAIKEALRANRADYSHE